MGRQLTYSLFDRDLPIGPLPKSAVRLATDEVGCGVFYLGTLPSKHLFLGIVCLLTGLLLCPLEALEATELEHLLVPATATEKRRLSATESHAYRAELDAGVWRLSLMQHGINAMTTLVLPDGSELGPYDSPVGRRGMESILVTMVAPGIVGVSIQSRSRTGGGHYSIRIDRIASIAADLPPLERAQLLAETAGTAAARSYFEGSQEDARGHYRRALSLWPANDLAGRARTLVALAILSRSADDFTAAEELFREALATWRTLMDRTNEATTLNRLGLTIDDLGDSAAARRLFEQALAIWQELEDPDGEVPVRLNLCLAFLRQGEFMDARSCYQAGLALVRELKQENRERIVLSNLAGVHWNLGEPNEALSLYEEVLAKSHEANDNFTIGRVLTTRALLFSSLGEAERALLDYGRALVIFRRLKSPRMEGTILSYLGATHLGLGELERAQTYLEQALPMLQAVGDKRGVAGVWRNLGRTYGRQEDEALSSTAFGKALDSIRDLGDRRGEAILLTMLGEAHAEAGSPQRAESGLQRALELTREFGDRRGQAQALLGLGKVRHQLDDAEGALELLAKAESTFRDVRDRAGQVRALEAIARLERDRGRSAQALIATAAAIELIEDLRTRAGSLRQRAAFLASRRGVFELHIDLLMQRHFLEPKAGHDRQAFALSERARSRAVLDLIQADGKIGGELRHRLDSATRRLAAQSERQIRILGRQYEPAEAAEADRQVAAALTDLERVQAAVRRQNSSFNPLLQGETLNVNEAMGLLDSGTLLLEYAIGEKSTFLWALSPDSMSSYELPGRAEIETLVRQAHADLSTLDLRTGQTSRQALDKLGLLLLSPVTARLESAHRVVVIADGALHFLPFAAMSRPGRGEPLVVSHEVVHLPSASTLAWQRRRTKSKAATKTLAVLADPVFDVDDSRLPGNSGAPVVAEWAPVDRIDRVRGDLGDLGRLPATGQEANAIISLVEEPTDRLLVLGLDAHRERVSSGELESYRYIHFATHGVINARHPELSGLVLALVDSQGKTRDGFLSMDDVSSLELSAEMVVLSGCQTAWGKEIRGEGLLGLTRGFMAAGVPRVVASLWSVQDEATARLMTEFYRGILAEGKPPATALADAQRAIREHSPWSDPYFWSAFVLLGDWRGGN